MTFCSPLFYRYMLLSICTVMACSFLSPAHAQNPTQPADLRSAVYSKSAAEIFWTRSSDNNLVVGYEVRVNGSIIGTLDATSYYANTYVAGTEYTLTVTAVDNEGNRSASSTVSFIGGDKDGVNEPPVSEPGPQSPTNLRASIYSQSTFELFWDRVTAETLSYEVFIDSKLVSKTFGISAIQRNLMAGTQYSVDVVAIDSQGKRSAATNLKVTMPGNPDVEEPPVTLGTGSRKCFAGCLFANNCGIVLGPSTFRRGYCQQMR